MQLIPAPMASAPQISCQSGSRSWLTSARAKPELSTAMASDSRVRVRS